MNHNGFALITGASGGLGMALARELDGRHHNLILVAHRIEPHGAFASELRQSKPITVLVSESDLCRPGAGNFCPCRSTSYPTEHVYLFWSHCCAIIPSSFEV